MRKIVLMSLFILAFCMTNAQDKNKKVTFEVKGNCGMCKARIEKASLKLKGVKYVNWNMTTKEFMAIMDESKCSVEVIKKAIAKVGHDTDNETATNEVYDKLPACCKYRDPNSIHLDHNSH